MIAQEGKLKKGEKVAQQAALLLSLLAAGKAIIGVLSGSIVLISDAIHSASDLISVFISWFGLKISQRKPDQRFPYGYYKAENLATGLIAFLILFAWWEIFTEGVSRLQLVSSIKIPFFALGISLLDALVLFSFGLYEVKVGREINSRSLIAMGEENKTHLFSSLAVFVGILAAYYRIPYLEGLITMVISFLILKIGLQAAKDSILALMDVSPEPAIERKIARAIESVPGIEAFFDLRLRRSGPFIFGETKVGIRRFVDVKRAHEIAEEVEETIKKKVPQVDSFLVHVEPFKTDFRHLVMPVTKKAGLTSLIADHFGRAPYFLFVNLRGKKIKGFYFLKNPHQKKPVRAGLAVTKIIAQQKSDTLITREIGEISLHALRDHLIDVYQAQGKTAKEVINRFLKGELKPLKQATRKKQE